MSGLDSCGWRSSSGAASSSEGIGHDIPDNFQVGVKFAVVGHGLVSVTSNHVDVVKVKVRLLLFFKLYQTLFFV